MKEERVIRWGLLGGGAILDRWMKGARQVDGMEITAIASRTPETAAKMAVKYNIPEVMTYEELVRRPDIDIVYVPVPHTAHMELAMMAMYAGKHVLVEKPAAVTAADFEKMTACAEKNGVFLMEAVWTRFFPLIGEIRKCIADGRIGRIRSVQSSFSFRVEDDYQGRLFDPMRAGGGLLDVGVYDLHFARMILDQDPLSMTGFASVATDALNLQVDEQNAWIAAYPEGVLGVFTSGIRTDMRDTAFIYGDQGYIEIPVFWKPSVMHVFRGGEKETITKPVPQRVEGMEDEGYQYELRHVNECLRNGLTESPMMPHSATLAVLKQCDELRRQWGIKYPFEK